MIVTINQGSLEGTTQTNVITGKPYYSFLGVPYAEPPVGDLRFRPPVAAKKWDGVFDATVEKNICIQADFSGVSDYQGSEDCLYLNVHTPELPGNCCTSLKPVIFYIHGGGFFSGSGSVDKASPDFLIRHGVVIVAVISRLNVFGFLNLGIPSCPGNVGLKDQACALKWVQENITKFGGDPSNVTLLGESSGGAAVHYQVISPYTRGLFHRAIAQNGTVLSLFALQPNPQEMAFNLGKKLGYQGTDHEELCEYLKRQSSGDLLKAANAVRSDLKMATPLAGKGIVFMPSIETIPKDAFITDDPTKMIKEAPLVPIITGVDEHEGSTVFYDVTAESLEKLNDGDKFNDVITQNIPYCNPAKVSEIAAKVKKFYFGDKRISWDTRMEFLKLYTDLHTLYLYDSFDFSAKSNGPIYVYEYLYDGKYNLSKAEGGVMASFGGPVHTDEMGYIIWPKASFPNPKYEGSDKVVVDNLTSMWTNFAKYGDPALMSRAGCFKWTRSTTDRPTYLQISKDFNMVKGVVYGERRLFWQGILRTCR